jgi:hypothetical protein
MKINQIEIYMECGRKAGMAAKRKDMATVQFHQNWINRAVAMETEENKAECRKAFSDAYRAESMPCR